MKRLWWMVGSAVLIFVVAPAAFLVWLFWGFDPLPATPFSSSYSLPSGEKVTVSGTTSTDFTGDTGSSYKVTLQFRSGKREVVTEGTVIDEEIPSGPFTLAETPTRLFLFSDHGIHTRLVAQGGWDTWSYKDDPVLPFLGRAIMPSSYARVSPSNAGCFSQSNNDCLPEVPYYHFERWNAATQSIVMQQIGASQSGTAALSLWPKRLVFRAEKLDVSRTLSLEPRFKLRPLPRGVRVEVLKMSLPNRDGSWADGNDESRYSKALKVRGARVLGREAWASSTRFHNSPLTSWWSAKGRTTFQLRGVCSDSDPNMLFFGWKVVGNAEQWGIAHNGQWRHIRESQYGFQSPYLFARFSWPVRQTHTRSQK